jgi:hypothetical protein
MTERLLQFLWQFQYFNRTELETEQGEPLQVIRPGILNKDQGPDFSEGKVRIGDTVWAGNIELHIQSSDWYKHAHHTDPNYKNIILHVVWKNDESETSGAPLNIPLLELQSRVSSLLLNRYAELMNSVCFVPCETKLQHIKPLVWHNWKERLLVERLQRKSGYILQLLEESRYHWEITFWWMIARNFGIRLNAEAFEAIARSIPLNIIARHKNQVQQLECLLFGQAGLLDAEFEEDYPVLLQKEYRFLQKKYKLPKVFVTLKFLRMRPSGFPTIRLAQLAILLQQSSNLFSKIRESTSVNEVKKLLNVTANDYWHYHYRFDEPCAFKVKNLGGEMINNILINTVMPVMFTYGHYQLEQSTREKALRWLEETEAENNVITRGWESLGIENNHAFDSQALIQLKTSYCDYRRCLDCAVGCSLLGSDRAG